MNNSSIFELVGSKEKQSLHCLKWVLKIKKEHKNP